MGRHSGGEPTSERARSPAPETAGLPLGQRPPDLPVGLSAESGRMSWSEILMSTSTTDTELRWLFAALVFVALTVTVTLFSGLRG